MPKLLEAASEMAAEYARWFVNRRAYTRQSDWPHRASGRHYYYRPKANGRPTSLSLADIQRHLAGEITIGLYAINPRTQRAKWMAIDADYPRSLDDLLKLQYALGRDGVQAALEQSRRGGHLWILFDQPAPAKNARRYIRHLAAKLLVRVKGSGPDEGIELFPKQDSLRDGQFGNALRGPLGVHRAAGRRYWFYGAPYELEAQMEYLRGLRRVPEQTLSEIVARLPLEPTEERTQPTPSLPSGRPRFLILDYVETERRTGRNWVAQCPSCAAANRDRGKDNLAISVDEPWKYLCWAGCTKEQIRAALGAPLPSATRR